jgi:hypothetical protein
MAKDKKKRVKVSEEEEEGERAGGEEEGERAGGGEEGEGAEEKRVKDQVEKSGRRSRRRRRV